MICQDLELNSGCPQADGAPSLDQMPPELCERENLASPEQDRTSSSVDASTLRLGPAGLSPMSRSPVQFSDSRDNSFGAGCVFVEGHEACHAGEGRNHAMYTHVMYRSTATRQPVIYQKGGK